MPDEHRLPPGPLRDLVECVHQLYGYAGTPPLRKISNMIRDRDDLPGTLSHDRVAAILKGSGTLPRWPNLKSLILIFIELSEVPVVSDQEVRRVHTHWDRARESLHEGNGSESIADIAAPPTVPPQSIESPDYIDTTPILEDRIPMTIETGSARVTFQLTPELALEAIRILSHERKEHD